MKKHEMEELAEKAREQCPACREDIPLKGTPSRQLVHLDVLATPEAAGMCDCQATDVLKKVIIGWDQRHNPLYLAGWEEIISDLWSNDPEIWDGPGEAPEPQG